MIAISSLTNVPVTVSISNNASVVNQSVLDEYERAINRQADMREYLVEYFDSMLISSSNTLKIQATSLAQLTQSTNQLTRVTLVRISFLSHHDGDLDLVQIKASQRCSQLASALLPIADQIPSEDVRLIADQLIQCATHVITVSACVL
jgi:hypothetical protein